VRTKQKFLFDLEEIGQQINALYELHMQALGDQQVSGFAYQSPDRLRDLGT
jgi:hypothetical protein